MKTLEEIKSILSKYRDELEQKFKVKEIGIFGSFVRGENRKQSDIDVLVEFKEGYKTFDNYMDLKFFLEEALNTKIDLVLKNVIREEIKTQILSETVYV